jgi:Fic family protein
MGQWKDLVWTSGYASGPASRRGRHEGAYRAYLPDRLAGRPFAFEGSVAADIADAERALTRLDAAAVARADTEALARLVLRAESVASSRIEGVIIAPQRLLRADVARADGEQPGDPTAAEVLANVDAMTYAVSDLGPITVDRLVEFHRRLLASTRRVEFAGAIRTQQNWIGGSSFSPIGAAFVPPPAADVPALLEDLCAFANDDALPAVAQAAIAHAQFETIHPFADGNGRTGRALVHMILRRRSLVTRTLPPVSLILATHANDYVAALQATRYEGAAASPAALASIESWVSLFAWACVRATASAEAFEQRVRVIQAGWRGRVAHLRSDATALELLGHLTTAPIVTARSAQTALRVSYPTANAAIDVLVKANIITPVRAVRRNRTFEARELIDAFTDLERQLASPDGDTQMSPPARRVPDRPAPR